MSGTALVRLTITSSARSNATFLASARFSPYCSRPSSTSPGVTTTRRPVSGRLVEHLQRRRGARGIGVEGVVDDLDARGGGDDVRAVLDGAARGEPDRAVRGRDAQFERDRERAGQVGRLHAHDRRPGADRPSPSTLMVQFAPSTITRTDADSFVDPAVRTRLPASRVAGASAPGRGRRR